MITWQNFLFIASVIIVCEAALPSFITPCSRSLPHDDFSKCLLSQVKHAVPYVVKGLPELGLEPLDPIPMDNVTVNTGAFEIKTFNVVMNGLKNSDIKEFKWDLANKKGLTRFVTNLTLVTDYSVEGRVFLLPVSGSGKMTVQMDEIEISLKYKIRTVTDNNGIEHIETYDLKPGQIFKAVRFHFSNLLGGGPIGESVEKVLNDNWKDVIPQVGPSYSGALSKKIHQMINKLYQSVPLDELLIP